MNSLHIDELLNTIFPMLLSYNIVHSHFIFYSFFSDGLIDMSYSHISVVWCCFIKLFWQLIQALGIHAQK